MIDARRLAIAMRDIDIVEKRQVDEYVGLAMELAAAYERAAVVDGRTGPEIVESNERIPASPRTDL